MALLDLIKGKADQYAIDRRHCYISGGLWSYSLIVKVLASSIVQSLQITEYPDRNDSTVRSMGFLSPVHRLTCYFINETYEDYPLFLADLYKSKNEIITLDHIDIGTIQGQIKLIDPRINEKKYTVELDIEFIQAGEYKPPTVKYSPSDVFDNALKAAMKGISRLAGQISDATDLSGLTSEINSTINTFDAMLGSISAPAVQLSAAIDFGESLAGRFMSSVSGVAEKYSKLYGQVKNALSFVSQMSSASQELIDSISGDLSSEMLKESAQIMFTQITATGYANILEIEGDNLQSQINIESEPSVDADGALKIATTGVPEIDDDGILIEKEIEIITMDTSIDTLNLLLTELQNSIGVARNDIPELLETAVILKGIVYDILLSSEQIITVIVPSDLPLYIILLQNNLPYKYDKRILALNPHIWNSNFITKGTELKIYAR